jgi:hypothetical protein
MNRRRLLQILAALPFARGLFGGSAAAAASSFLARPSRRSSMAADEAWEELGRRLDGQLIKVVSPLSACVGAPSSDAWAHVAGELKNPY